jgi:tRNA(fMet)-specific endonuclease VapC
MYMLDTNICIYIIKKRNTNLLNKLDVIPTGPICVSVITYAELQYGVERSSSKRLNQRVLDIFLSHLKVLAWDTDAADQYAKARSYLEGKGSPIGNMDLLIAAHALSRKNILVTHNTREFARVPKLKYEDWAE